MRLLPAFAAAATLAAAIPASASASIAGLGGIDRDVVTYAAAPGEQNRVTVSASVNEVTFQDTGATIEAGDGCKSSGPHRVTCAGASQGFYLSVQLEDGDDEADTSGVSSAGQSFYIEFDGGSGNDTLKAGNWAVALDGGVGADVLEGGPGTPVIDGTDAYASGSFDQLPSRDPARDTITCALASETQAPTAVSIDQQDQVSGPCGSTSLYLKDHVEVRGTPGNDSLYPGRGPSLIYGLEGDDTLQVDHGDRGYGGPGDDNLSGTGLLVGGKGNDRLDAGQQQTARSSLSGGPGNDFITGSDGRNKIDAGSGQDRVSSRGGNDEIMALDKEHDTIRCGPGRDLVTADRRDSVAKDCETVLRRVAATARHASASAADTSARAARNRHCAESKKKGSRIVARTSTSVVWTRGTFSNFGCIYKQGKVRHLPDEGGGIKLGKGGPAALKLSGRYTAYATFGSAIGDEFDRVYVYDIRAGRLIVLESSNLVSSIVLKPNGSVAWIQGSIVEPANSDTNLYEVRKVGLAEKQGNVLIDRSSGIAPASLKLSADGASVTWTRDGAEQTAPLG